MVFTARDLGLPPKLMATIYGLNIILSNLGFPRWTLVRWRVPPLMSLWLLLVLIFAGLRTFAMFEFAFVLYKFFEECGDPVSGLFIYGISDSRISYMQRSPSQPPNSHIGSKSQQPKRKILIQSAEDDDSDD